MARRRQVVRVERRERVLDLSMTAIAVLLVLTGVLTVVPGSAKEPAVRAACRVLTLGLTDCNPRLYDAPATTLGPARCQPLSDLDRYLPEVRTQRLEFGTGQELLRHTARDGTVYLETVQAEDSRPPEVWAGEEREWIAMLPGASLPAHTRWRFPAGAGEEELIRRLQTMDDAWTLGQGPLAAFVDPGPEHARVPWDLGPAQVESVVRPAAVLPPVDLAEPGAQAGTLAPDPEALAVLMTDRVNATSWITMPLTGGEDGLVGAIRIGRDAGGMVSTLVLAVVSHGWPGAEAPDAASASASYLTLAGLAVSERSEHDVVQRWLERGAPVDLGVLLGDSAPAAGDQFALFLSNAATVTVVQQEDFGWAADDWSVTSWLARGLRSMNEGEAVEQVWRGDRTSDDHRRELKLRPKCAAR